MASIAPLARREQTFYQKMSVGLVAFIVFGFAQFEARGFVDPRALPLAIHLHAAMMVGWLALLVVQSTLVARDNLALHRRLGWAGAVLVTAIPPVAIVGVVAVMRAGIAPPFFTPAFYLSLVTIEATLFAAMVWLAIARRKQTAWHRRLMIGATVLLMEPALGRLLPVPLMGAMPAEWTAMVIQLLMLGFLLRHDRKGLGKVHPATTTAAIAVILSHVLVALAAMLPPVIALADAIAA